VILIQLQIYLRIHLSTSWTGHIKSHDLNYMLCVQIIYFHFYFHHVDATVADIGSDLLAT
jgi:hypothetical protein